MRNRLFPQRVCDYVTFAKAQELKQNKVSLERDTSFGKSIEEDAATANLPKPKEKTKIELDFMPV